MRGRGERERDSPIFHVLLDQCAVVTTSSLIGPVTKVGRDMDSMLVVVVMDTTTQVHFHYIGLVTDISLQTKTHTHHTST